MALAWLAALLLASAPALAQSERAVFTVSGIEVDVTAADAVTARAEALDEGQREGLRLLLDRLSGGTDAARLPDPATLPVERYVRSFEIDSEELSSTRYIASLTVSYEPRLVRELLEGRGIAVAVPSGDQVLVLPLYEVEGRLRLWEDPNPWRDAWWRTFRPDRSLVQIVLPLGDLQDVTTIDGDLAFRGDRQAIERLQARYAVDEVLVARATPSSGPAGEVLRFDLRRVAPSHGVEFEDSVEARPGDSEAMLMATGVARVVRALESRSLDQREVPSGPTSDLRVEVALADLSDWVRLNRLLAGLPEVRDTRIDSFARQSAQLRLVVVGDLFTLRSALAREGLELWQEGETWRLQRMVASPGQPPAPPATRPSF
jgi:hypothetical protein